MTTHSSAPASATTEASFQSPLGALLLTGIAFAAGVWMSGRLDQQSARTFPGRLQARVVTITAERPARLTEIRVRTGQRVAAGEPLFVLNAASSTVDPQRPEQDAARRQAAAELELLWRRRELQAEIFQTQFKLAGLRQEKLHLEVEQVAWQEQLSVQTVFVSNDRQDSIFRFLSDTATDVPEQRLRAMLREDAAAAAAKALTAQIALCEHRLEELQTLDRTLETQIRASHGVANANQQSPRAIETDDPADVNADDGLTTVASPSYGLIGQFRKQAGDSIQPGDVLVQILDDDRRTIEVEIPSSAVVRFTPGQRIRLEFPGREQRTGVIAAIPPETSPATGDPTDDAAVKLIVEPAGKLWPAVPIGSRVLVYQP